MTFRELFNNIINKMESEGMEKFDAYTYAWHQIELDIFPFLENTPWKKAYVWDKYKINTPAILFRTEKASSDIDIRIKLTVKGKLYDDRGPMLYLPKEISTEDPEIMDKDIVTYLNELYENSSGVRLEREAKGRLKSHQALIDEYVAIIEKMNALPLEDREAIYRLPLPELNYWK